MPIIQLTGLQCSRCMHKWIPREMYRLPLVCPKCKSPYWNSPRIKNEPWRKIQT